MSFDVTLKRVNSVTVTTTTGHGQYLDVAVEDAEIEDLLGVLELSDIFDHYGDEIVEYAKDNYNLTEVE